MLKDKQEILVFGELVLFAAAWVFGVAATLDDYRSRTNSQASGGDNMASNSNFSGEGQSGFSQPSFLRQPGDYE